MDTDLKNIISVCLGVAVIFMGMIVILSFMGERNCINGAMQVDDDVSVETIQFCFDTF